MRRYGKHRLLQSSFAASSELIRLGQTLSGDKLEGSTWVRRPLGDRFSLTKKALWEDQRLFDLDQLLGRISSAFQFPSQPVCC